MIQNLEQRFTAWEEQYKLLLIQKFCRKSEKSQSDESQQLLFVVDHLPYYSQEGRFERLGIQISRQNMSNWQQMAYEKIRPLLDLLKKHIQSGPVINRDETPVQVLGEEGRKDTQKSYIGVVRGGPSERTAQIR